MKRIVYAVLFCALLSAPKAYSVCNEVVLAREFESSLSGKKCLRFYWCDGRKATRCWGSDMIIEKTVLNKPMGTATVTYTQPASKRTQYCDLAGSVDRLLCRLWRTYKKTLNITAIEEEQGYVDVEAEFEAAPKEYYQ